MADVESGVHLSAWKGNPLKLVLGRQGILDQRPKTGMGSNPGPGPQVSAFWGRFVFSLGTALSEGWEAGTAWLMADAVVSTQSVGDVKYLVK